MSVGKMLDSHASGLGKAMIEVVDRVVAADDRAKRLALERYKMLLKEPPIEMPFIAFYQKPNPDVEGELQWCSLNFTTFIPPIFLEIGTAPIITKFTFDSSFQAIITRKLEVTSETEVGFSAGWGGWGPPNLQLDITQKIGVTFGEDSTQSNSLDIHQTWEQSPVPFGIRVLQESLAVLLQRVFSGVIEDAVEDPVILTDQEFAAIQEQLNPPEEEEEKKDEEKKAKRNGS